MKRFILLIIIHYLLSTANCSSQTPTWTRILGGPRNDAGRSAFQTTDANFLLVGTRNVRYINNPMFFIPQTYIAKFSPLGNMLWQRYYGDSLIANYGYAAVEDPQGNFLCPLTAI